MLKIITYIGKRKRDYQKRLEEMRIERRDKIEIWNK